MNKTLSTILISLCGLLAVIIVIGLLIPPTDDETSTFSAPPEIPAQEAPEAPTAVPTPEPIPEPAPAPVEAPGADLGLGDDPHFNELAAECDGGDIDACDTLYWTSPVDSDYETFGLERGSVAGELAPWALDMVWEAMSQSERDDLCLGLVFIGAEEAAQTVSEGSDGLISVEAAAEFLEGACG